MKYLMYKAAVKALTPRYCFILLAMYMRYTLNFVLRLVFFCLIQIFQAQV